MDDTRYKSIMVNLGMPNSRSLLHALQQVANEVGQESAAKITSLRAECERLRADAERLDWLIANPDATVCSEGPNGPFHVWFRYSMRAADERTTPRAAIDAARAGKGE